MSIFAQIKSGNIKTVNAFASIQKREYQPAQSSPLQTKIVKPGVSRTMQAIDEMGEIECFEDNGVYSIEY
jgi:hypothetical protein